MLLQKEEHPLRPYHLYPHRLSGRDGTYTTQKIYGNLESTSGVFARLRKVRQAETSSAFRMAAWLTDYLVSSLSVWISG